MQNGTYVAYRRVFKSALQVCGIKFLKMRFKACGFLVTFTVDTGTTFRTSLYNLLHQMVVFTMKLAKAAGEVKKQRLETPMKVLQIVEKGEQKKNYNNQKNKHKKDDDGDDSTELDSLDSGASVMLQHEIEYFYLTPPGDFGVVRILGWVILGYLGLIGLLMKMVTTTVLVERQTGKKLKCIRSDNGGEYIGPFDAYCREHGIQHQKIPRDTTIKWFGRADDRTLGFGSGKMSFIPLLSSLGCKASVHFPKMKDQSLISGSSENNFDAQFGDDIQNDEEQNDERTGADDVDAQEQPNLDEDVHPELPYVLLTDGGEPECYAEAMEDEHKKEWFDAMQDEMKSLLKSTPRPRYKARLVVKGFSQKKGIDFRWIFSPVVKMGSIRVVLGLAASLDLEVEQMDVKTAFLHGDLDKEIYMEQPEGFQVKGKEDYVCRLQKSLYGLKQAPRQWYKKFESVIGKQGFRKIFSDHCVFFQRFNMDKAKVVSSPLTPNFKPTDKDCPSSKKNIEKMDRVPYASAVGSLMYAMVCTRPDLAHAVGIGQSAVQSKSLVSKHWEDFIWIFRYLREAEYVAATEACKELLWLKRFLQELGFKQQRYAVLCDNQSTIHLAKNSMFHKRTKHIDIRYHWIRDAIERWFVKLNTSFIRDEYASDMLTKAVAREKLKICCSFAGMANSSS
ncbi:retrovirus-related pol polyprotein from transposon TNT 1-94 [Tanacetum coccineum]